MKTGWSWFKRFFLLPVWIAAFSPLPLAPIAWAGLPSPSVTGKGLVYHLVFQTPSPNILPVGHNFAVDFDYLSDVVGQVIVTIAPYTDGSPSPGVVMDPPLALPAAGGSGRCEFTFTAGPILVDSLRVRMTGVSDPAQVLYETWIPVEVLFSASPNLVYGLAFTPNTPNVLGFNDPLQVDFSYRAAHDRVSVSVQPFSGGRAAANAVLTPAEALSVGSHTGSASFTLTAGQTMIDQVRIAMLDAAGQTALFEAFLPVNFRFRPAANSVSHFTLTPGSLNRFRDIDFFLLNFSYSNNWAGDAEINILPFSGPAPTSGVTGTLNGIVPPGTGAGSLQFRIPTSAEKVDKIRVQMRSGFTVLSETFLPVNLGWGMGNSDWGPDVRIDALEATQAIQDLDNSSILVAGKRTYVRLHVSSLQGDRYDVHATLTGRRGWARLSPVLVPGNPGGDIVVSQAPDRAQVNDAFWFELPDTWTQAGDLTLTAYLDPNGSVNDPNPANNTRSLTLRFTDTPALYLTLYNVAYTQDGVSYLADGSHLEALESWLRSAYPLSSLQVRHKVFRYPAAGLPNAVTLNSRLARTKKLNILLSGESPRVVYYGVVDDGAGLMRGGAVDFPVRVASGPAGAPLLDRFEWDSDGTYADWYGGHEIAHALGLPHAGFCGSGGSADYPYPDGGISPAITGPSAAYGFDIRSRTVYPPFWKDLMTSCGFRWVSPYTYINLHNALLATGGGGWESTGPAGSAVAEFLVVSGVVNLAAPSAELFSVERIRQDVLLAPSTPGGWDIALVGADGVDLALNSFAPAPLSVEEDQAGALAVFAEAVPWVEGTRRVEIRGGGRVLAVRSASANPPTVTLNAPPAGTAIPPGPFQVSWTAIDPDGDPLTYSLWISRDGGTTWEELAAQIQSQSIQLNTADLPGGPARFRVLAADGFLTGQAAGGDLTLPSHPPDLQILNPLPGQVFYPGQQILLQAIASDLEDGALGGGALTWTSSIDGVLGDGANLDASFLSQGIHTVTLSALDRGGFSAQAQVSIKVEGKVFDEPTAFEVAPLGLGLEAVFGSDPRVETLTLRKSTPPELPWQASVNVAWLRLSAAEGGAPGNLSVTIDPRGMPPGRYSASVSLSAPYADVNQSVEVPIILTVTGSRLYLPAVRR